MTDRQQDATEMLQTIDDMLKLIERLEPLELDDEQKQMLDTILDQVQRMKHLILRRN